MCLICIEYQKNKLTFCEAWKNLAEMKPDMDAEHAEAVEEMLWEDWFCNMESDNFLVSTTNAYENYLDDSGDFWFLGSWYDEHGQGD